MDWLYDLIIQGSAVNVRIQSFRTPFFDVALILITLLGSEEFYLAFTSLIYWSINKAFGRRLIYLLTLSGYLNAFFKNWFDLPRPFQVDSRVVALTRGTSYGLPSGHAQLAVTLWGYIAWALRRLGGWVVLVAGLVIALVIFSRLYLGVHFPADVIAGAALGLMVLVLWLNYEARLSRLPAQFGHSVSLAAAISIPLLLLFLMPDDAEGYPAVAAATSAGILLGVNLGFFYEARYTRFACPGTVSQHVGRYFLGLILVLAFWVGLRLAFGLVEADYFVTILLRFVRYALAGCALTWWAPALFVRLGLAAQESEKPALI